MVRVVIAAPYAAARAHLQGLLEAAPDLLVVGEVSGGAELEAVLPELQPDAVLLDYPLAGGPALLPISPMPFPTRDEAVRRLRRCCGSISTGLSSAHTGRPITSSRTS